LAGEISYNTVVMPKREHFWERDYYGLTFEQDPRPRCTLILGDGFTQGFLESQGLRNKIRMSINDHFPPPENVMYLPVENDCFEKSYLWDLKKWPRLYSLWEESHKLAGRDFYSSLPKSDVNRDKRKGQLSYDTGSVGFELRCYLWHLFRAHHIELMSHINSFDLNKWEWIKPFSMLMSEFALGVASFNYDLLIEFILHEVYRAQIIPHDLGVEGDFLRRPINSIALYKMHGSIAYYLNTGMSHMIRPRANPWLEGSIYNSNSIGNAYLDINTEMRTFPEFPDMVPPGHYGEDKLNPQSAVLPLSKCHINASKLVVFCGLSAAEPDTDEVRELIGAIPSDAVVIQVGLNCDRGNPLAQLLSARGLNSTFLLPEELRIFSEVIGNQIPLYRDWSKF